MGGGWVVVSLRLKGVGGVLAHRDVRCIDRGRVPTQWLSPAGPPPVYQVGGRWVEVFLGMQGQAGRT